MTLMHFFRSVILLARIKQYNQKFEKGFDWIILEFLEALYLNWHQYSLTIETPRF